MTENKLQVTKEVAEELIKLLGFESSVEVSEDQENEAVQVQIGTEEPGALIGYHGETISALQLVMGIIINRRLGEWSRVIVNIGDYREKREEILKRMALNAAQKAHFSGKPVILTDLTAQERRIVHLVLQENTDVETYSEGEGRERKLIIKPR